MRHEIFRNNPLFDGRGVFATSGRDIDEMLDFIEDMILMTGCPECSSLNTRLIVEDDVRSVLCLDCGTCEELPPAS